jgi:hypothetical protein
MTTLTLTDTRPDAIVKEMTVTIIGSMPHDIEAVAAVLLATTYSMQTVVDGMKGYVEANDVSVVDG